MIDGGGWDRNLQACLGYTRTETKLVVGRRVLFLCSEEMATVPWTSDICLAGMTPKIKRRGSCGSGDVDLRSVRPVSEGDYSILSGRLEGHRKNPSHDLSPKDQRFPVLSVRFLFMPLLLGEAHK